MASGNAVWGIDIGQCALKALKLRPAEDGKVEAVAFDVIDHPKILSQPDADRDELISSALEKFASRNDWQGDKFIIGVPGQQTFARFCKMPPIDLKKDAKKIPELVRYEASQQVPFDMDDVVWDYQVFTSEDSPDIEVGIFAMRKDLIRRHLEFFTNVGISPAGVQTVPAALYNFCQFDGRTTEEGKATVIIDVGAQNTDLIIVEPESAWTRNIPLGGNSFTEALVRAFKLSFAKAENLKRSAATSKYARQIFQAMRPVFADLVAEIQRSIGFYSSTHRDIELTHVLALGNAFRLPGLQKYLENNLTIPGGVSKIEKFSKIVPSATTNAPQFSENILTFSAAYGLALQGLGMAKIEATLLPTELARVAAWKRKQPYFMATAASLLMAAAIPAIGNWLDMQQLESSSAEADRRKTQEIIREARDFRDKFNQAQTDTTQREQDIQNLLKLQDQKGLVPRLIALVHEAKPPMDPQLERVQSASELRELVQSNPTRFARTNRGQLIIESFRIEYVDKLASATVDTSPVSSGRQPGGPPGGAPGMPPGMAPGSTGGFINPYYNQPSRQEKKKKSKKAVSEDRGFVVHVVGRLLHGRNPAEASQWLRGYATNLRELSRRDGLGFYIPDDAGRNDKAISDPELRAYHGAQGHNRLLRPMDDRGEADRAQYPDPLTGEETQSDWKVGFSFKVKIGEPPEPESTESTEEVAGATADQSPA